MSSSLHGMAKRLSESLSSLLQAVTLLALMAEAVEAEVDAKDVKTFLNLLIRQSELADEIEKGLRLS